MKPSMAKTSHFHWTTNNKVTNNNDDHNINQQQQQQQQLQQQNPTDKTKTPQNPNPITKSHRRNLQSLAASRLRSAVASLTRRRLSPPSRVTGTLFGRRRGHVSFSLQNHPSSDPSFLVQLATPISFLVKEMASGLVRIALECDRTTTARHLAEEVTWRAFCNGKRCGFATRRVYGERERRVLKAVEMVSMGAGVLPPGPRGERKVGKGEDEDEDEGEEEVMYMRARFERVVGDRDSEAFYMMNPDSNGAPELSIYLLRV